MAVIQNACWDVGSKGREKKAKRASARNIRRGWIQRKEYQRNSFDLAGLRDGYRLDGGDPSADITYGTFDKLLKTWFDQNDYYKTCSTKLVLPDALRPKA